MTDVIKNRLIGDRYRVTDRVGDGGMGVVYRATDRLTQRTIALKSVTMPAENLQFASKSGNDNLRMALAQEFKVLASLRHPHIISVLDYGFDAARNPFFTMGYLDDARTIVEAGHDQPIEEKLRLLMEVLQALRYLHRRDILHRDLKPANILVTAEGTATVLDFGLSARADEASGIAGTLLYMAPEIFSNKGVSQATDLFALGLVAYEMLTGRYPFQTDNTALLIADILHTDPDMSAIEPPTLRLVLTRWLSKTPETRYADADELINDLNRAMGWPLAQETTAIRESFLQSAQFVGREAELNQLMAALAEAADGRGSAWLLGGESGVGKSRLIDELRSAALVEGAQVIRGHAVDGAGAPYQVWRDIVRRLLLSVEVSDLEAGILAELVPDIRMLLERENIAAPPELIAQAAQERLIQTVVSLVRRQPGLTVLLLEDLHWSREGLVLLKTLTEMLEVLPLLVIGTYRDDERPDLPQLLPNMRVMTLPRFSPGLIEALSVSMLGASGHRSELLQLLQKETEGNAFFLVEVVRALVEDAGMLSEVGNVTLPQHIVTGGIQQVMRRRVSNIPPAMHAMLKLAAVLGREIDPALLAQIETADSVERWLVACQNAVILTVQENRWLFAHDKLRETVLYDLSHEEIVSLNQQAAEVIEMTYGDDVSYAAVLSDHWHAAQNTRKATQYAMIATEKAAAVAAYHDTLTYARRAIDGLGESPDAKRDKVRMLYHAGRAHFGLGERDAAKGAYEEAVALADQIDDRVGKTDVLYELATIYAMQGDFAGFQARVEEAFAIAQQKKHQGYGYMILSGLARMGADYAKAEDYMTRGLSLFRESGDVFGLAASLNDQGIYDNQLGRFDDAWTKLGECLDLMRQIGNPRNIVIALSNLGLVAMNRGDYAEAHTILDQGLSLAREIRDRNTQAIVLNRIGFVCAHQGDFVAAQHFFNECIEIGRAINSLTQIAQPTVGLAAIAAAQEDFASAHAQLEEAIEIGQKIGAWLHSWALLAQGNVQSLSGDIAGAVQSYAESLALLVNLREPWRSVVTQSKTGFNLGRADDDEAASQTLLAALDTAWEMRALPVVLDVLMGVVLLHLNAGSYVEGAELAGLIAAHPALSAIDTRPWLDQVIRQCQRRLPPAVYDEAFNHGAQLDLEVVVKDLASQRPA